MADTTTLRKKIYLKEKAKIIFNDKSRFRILICGRRWGKTKYAIVETLRELSIPNRRVSFTCPTLSQAKKIFVMDLISLLGDEVKSYNNQDNILTCWNGSELHVYGETNFQKARGNYYHFVIFDEAAQLNLKVAWEEVFRPCLSTTRGRALFISTPRGKSSYLYDLTLSNKYTTYQFRSVDGGWIPEEEIEEAMEVMDKHTFEQEYLASFNSAQNTCYDSFEDENILPPSKCKFDKNKAVVMSWDFNVNPLCCVVLQKNNMDQDVVIKEFYMNHTKTFEGISQVREWLLQQGIKESKSGTRITCYGDFAGNQSKSSASRSDWEIIEAEMKNFNFRTDVIPTKTIKDRVTSLNTRLCNARGERKLFVNSECKNLIRDLRKVSYKENSFTLDDSDKSLTHASDSLSYYTNRVYPTYYTITETKYS